MGIGTALKEYVDNINRQGTRVQLEVSPHLGRFNRELEITVYRIVEEALDNVSRRSVNNATTVRLMRSDSSLLLEIESPQVRRARLRTHRIAGKPGLPEFTNASWSTGAACISLPPLGNAHLCDVAAGGQEHKLRPLQR